MEKFSLRWNDFQSTVSNSFKILKQEQDLFDVTLVSDDQKQIQSHKVVLSACSSFFKPILQKNTHSHPLIYLSGIDSTNLQFIIDYVYEGEVQLFQEHLDSFLDSAQRLQIAGLLSNQKEESEYEESRFENDDSRNENAQFFEQEEKQENSFETSGINSQNPSMRNKTVVTVSGHDQLEVNRKINEILIKEGDYLRCTGCGKTSMTRDDRNMRRHVELHIEGLSYECQFCNNTFR